mgnify:CR=1 FL=1
MSVSCCICYRPVITNIRESFLYDIKKKVLYLVCIEQLTSLQNGIYALMRKFSIILILEDMSMGSYKGVFHTFYTRCFC